MMQEGLFWVIGFPDKWELLTFFTFGDTISHKEAWEIHIQPAEKRFRQVAYNYYPRGRVVIRNGRATVFLNQHIATKEVIQRGCGVFFLEPPRIHAEGGHHYQCFMDRK